MGLSFTNAAGPRQRSHSQVRVPRDSWPYFTVWDSRLPQLGGQVPVFIPPQEQGGPVIAPGTGFHFHRLQWLARLRWRYWNLPPQGILHARTFIFGENEKVTGGLRNLHTSLLAVQLHNSSSSPTIIRVLKWRSIRWAEHVARMGDEKFM
jgi:hypothetical protein